MGRFWAVVFLLVPVFGVGSFVAAVAVDYWLPEDVSEHGHQIDHLFNFILWLTGAVFVATEIALFWYLWKYDGARNPEAGKFTHGNHTLEVVWTLLPAATLLFIAIYQINAWADVKMRRPTGIEPLVEVTARQFEWRLRYPYTWQDKDRDDKGKGPSPLFDIPLGPEKDLEAKRIPDSLRAAFQEKNVLLPDDALVSVFDPGHEWRLDAGFRRFRVHKAAKRLDVYDQDGLILRTDADENDPRIKRDAAGRPIYAFGPDDVYAVNDMHVPVDETVVVNLKSMDVLHSFFLPNLRVKQDAVPGNTIPVWFRAKQAGKFDLVCAELCGWGHYKMKGRLTVEGREDYDKWLVKLSQEQKATQ